MTKALYGGQDVSWPSVEEFKQSVPSFTDFSWVHFELMSDWQFDRIYAMNDEIQLIFAVRVTEALHHRREIASNSPST